MEDYKIIVQASAGRRGPHLLFSVNAIKKALTSALLRTLWERRRVGDALFHQELGDLVLLCLLPVLPLNGLHLVLETQFQLLQPYFFELFVFGEITFLGE